MRAGIRTVIIPVKNKKDLNDIPVSVKKKIRFIPVKDIDEIFDLVFEEDSEA